MCFCDFCVTGCRWIPAVLLFSLLDLSRSWYNSSHSIKDWSAAVHWGVQSHHRHYSLHFSVFLSFSLSLFFYGCLSLSVAYPIRPNTGLSPICPWVHANECHHHANKVITLSSPLTPRGQIEPFVVHIKAITLPQGWDRAGGEDGSWTIDRDQCYPPFHLNNRSPAMYWWWPFMSVLTLVCLSVQSWGGQSQSI